MRDLQHVNNGEDDIFDIDLDSCGDTKGCFREPAGCDAADCDMVAAWTPQEGTNTYVEFELQAQTDGWVGLGFSHDTSMVRA